MELTLSKDDVKAIKGANEVAVSTYVRDGERIACLLVGVKTYTATPVWTVPQQVLYTEEVFHGFRRRTIPIDAAACRFEQYEGRRVHPAAYADGYEGMATTLAGIVREGDLLGLKFVVGDRNDVLRDANLYRDDAYLMVQRSSVVRATLLVKSSVSPDNTARMVTESRGAVLAG